MRRKISAAAEAYQAKLEEFQAVEAAYAEALLEGYRDGMTWKEVAQAAGLESEGQARIRAERAMGGEVSPSRRRKAAKAVPAPEPPGLSVAAAAKQLGVAPSTVYARVDRGEIKSVTDSLGRTRIILDD